MKILVLDDDYPSEKHLYGDVFAHTRVKEYIKLGHSVRVLSKLYGNEIGKYFFEGVEVEQVGIQNLFEFIMKERPDIVLVHFVLPGIYNILLKIPYPVMIWVHGFEALGWYRRLFNLKMNLNLIRTIRNNTIHMFKFRNFIRMANRNEHRFKFVFVSNWMKRIAEKDSLSRFNNFEIIANPIDDKLFTYTGSKDPELRKSILLIRPFTNKKYATDIATKSLIILSKKEWFSKLKIKIYGGAADKSDLAEYFKGFSNVKIEGRFLSQIEIKELHNESGVFLCPSRQDAQGVSMCEAMSSGLVVISSNNTAIPEFIEDGISGFLTDNTPEKIVQTIELIYENPSLFSKVSSNANRHIVEKCGIEKIINLEINAMSDLINSNKK